MSEATAPQRAIAADADALTVIAAEVLDEIRAARQDIARARAEGSGSQLQAAVIDARLADIAGDFRAAIAFRAAADVLADTAPALEAVPGPERGRHRGKPRRRPFVPRQRDTLFPWPRAVEGIAAAPLGVKLVAGLVAGLVLTGGGVAAVRTVLSHPAVPASVPASASASAPGWGTLVPDPSSSLIALTKPKGKPDAAKARVVDPDPFPAAPSSPASSPVQPARPSSSQSAARVTGQLQVSALELDLGTAATETVTLTARLGPVTWSAATDSADVTLDSSGGTLDAGESVTLTVTVNPLDTATQATITFTAGYETLPVLVTWILPLPSPLPSVLPSPLPT